MGRGRRQQLIEMNDLERYFVGNSSGRDAPSGPGKDFSLAPDAAPAFVAMIKRTSATSCRPAGTPATPGSRRLGDLSPQRALSTGRTATAPQPTPGSTPAGTAPSSCRPITPYGSKMAQLHRELPERGGQRDAVLSSAAPPGCASGSTGVTGPERSAGLISFSTLAAWRQCAAHAGAAGWVAMRSAKAMTLSS